MLRLQVFVRKLLVWGWRDCIGGPKLWTSSSSYN